MTSALYVCADAFPMLLPDDLERLFSFPQDNDLIVQTGIDNVEHSTAGKLAT